MSRLPFSRRTPVIVAVLVPHAVLGHAAQRSGALVPLTDTVMLKTQPWQATCKRRSRLARQRSSSRTNQEP